MRLNLLFSKHHKTRNIQQVQAPTGLLTLASYLWREVPGVSTFVYDANLGIDISYGDLAEADIVGFSTWFSNYEAALDDARGVKELNPLVKVVFGGPHAGAIAQRV